ncbi:hypothetical protein [Xanthomonas arboricola]|uniref:hypothetical protein n=1 Tax=Xanthomonas arboricola TaxID=56448 RepID=UPI0015E2DC8D
MARTKRVSRSHQIPSRWHTYMPGHSGCRGGQQQRHRCRERPVGAELMPPRDSAPAIGRSSAWQRLFSAWIDAIAGARVHSSAGAAYNMGCPALISPTDGF